MSARERKCHSARAARLGSSRASENVARASRAVSFTCPLLYLTLPYFIFLEPHRERAEPSGATRTWRSGNPTRAAARARASSFRSSGRSWLARHINGKKKGCIRREKEELKEGSRMAMALGNPGITRSYGVKCSSVSVTRPALFRPETGSWHHHQTTVNR